jgi:CRISPR-associated protein Csx17
MNNRTTILLSACRPDPLASYLKSLAILRLVSEQKDREARGWWQNGVFALHSVLNHEALMQFLLYEYIPTPIVAPWNGGSGFFLKDRRNGLETLRESEHQRFEEFRTVILLCEKILENLAITTPPSGTAQKNIKNSLLIECRNKMPDKTLAWIDAAYVLTSGGVQYPPLLGTGGNDGRLEFTNNFIQRLSEMIDPHSGHPKKSSEELCEAALWSTPSANLIKELPIGQFLPGNAGGSNAGPGYDAGSILNPWEFILLMEGAVLFGAAVTRRLQVADPGVMSAPFTVRSSMAGYASAAPDDTARAELWLPLWERPATLVEIQMLFSEGRSQIGRRPSRTGVDFVRAIATLGVDRGITSFNRIGFIERNGQAYLATPLGHWPVHQHPEVNLINDIDNWLDRFRGFTSSKRAPASLGRCLRTIEGAIMGVCKDATASQWQRLIIALGDAERQLAKSPRITKDNNLAPLPRLRPEWLKPADDGSSEFRLAGSLASIYDVTLGPLRANMIPMAADRPYPAFKLDKMDDNAVVWGEGSLTKNLLAVIQRRLLEYRQSDLQELPLKARLPADLADVSLFLEGLVDESKIEKLLWGLNAIDWYWVKDAPYTERVGEPLVPASYALLKLTHMPGPVRFDFDDPGIEVRLDPTILARAQSGQITVACRIASRRLNASGLQPKTANFTMPPGQGNRIAASILFPLREADLIYLARMVIKSPVRNNR